MNFHCLIIFMSEYKIRAIYERPRVNVKVERGSTLTFTGDIYARKNYSTVKNLLKHAYLPHICILKEGILIQSILS